MHHHDIARRMPALKFEADTHLHDVGAMLDELAACPPDHERAGQLKQQIASKLDTVRGAIDQAQPDEVPATESGERETVGSAEQPRQDADPDEMMDALLKVASLKTVAERGDNPSSDVEYDDAIITARKALGMHDEPIEHHDAEDGADHHAD